MNAKKFFAVITNYRKIPHTCVCTVRVIFLRFSSYETLHLESDKIGNDNKLQVCITLLFFAILGLYN